MRWYRAALRLFPADLRREMGTEMVHLANDLRADRGAFRTFMILGLDLAVTVPRYRWESAMSSMTSPATPSPELAARGTRAMVALGALLAAPVLVALIVGPGAPALVLAVVALAFLLARRTTLAAALRPAVETDSAVPSLGAALRQAWWAPLAFVVGILTIALAAMIGLRGEDAVSRVIGTIVPLAFGTLAIGGLFVRLRRPGLGSLMVMLGVSVFGTGFWLVWPPVITAAIWVGVIVSGFRAPKTASSGPTALA